MREEEQPNSPTVLFTNFVKNSDLDLRPAGTADVAMANNSTGSNMRSRNYTAV